MASISNVVQGTPIPMASGTWIQQRNALRALGARQKNATKVTSTPSKFPTSSPSALSYTKPTVPLATGLMPTAATAPLATPQPAPSTGQDLGSFKGLVSTTANTALSGSPDANNYSKEAADYGAGAIPIGQQAIDIAKQFGQKYADVGTAGAKFQAGQLTTGTTPVAEGNAAITAQTTAAQQQALAEGETAALKGLDEQLTAQNQAQTGALGAAGVSATTRGQTLSTLGNLAGLVQPSTVTPGQAVFNPATGEFTGGGDLGAGNIAQNWASFLAGGGDPNQVPASVSGNSVLWNQVLQGAKAQNPNFDVNTALGQASGRQAVGAAGGTGAAQVLAQLPSLESANTAAKGIEQTITQFLQDNPKLNTSPLAVGNAAQQWLQGKQLADPTYQTLFNYLNEYTNTLAPILGVGGDPTNLKTEIAKSFINAQASGQSIAQVLQSIGTLADQKIQNIRSGATGGGVVSSGTNNGTTSGDIFNW